MAYLIEYEILTDVNMEGIFRLHFVGIKTNNTAFQGFKVIFFILAS